MRPTVQYRTSTVATVLNVPLSGRPGIGVSVLLVHVAAMLQASKASPRPYIVTIGGRLKDVGPLVAQNVWWPCVDFAQEHNVSLEAFLTTAQVRALDEARDGKGELQLTLSLEGLIVGEDGLFPFETTVPIIVTNSDWVRLVAEMNFEDRATFEVPISGGRVAPPLDKAAAFVQAAIERFHHRQWADALTQCRQALDALQDALSLKKPQWHEWSDKDTREAWGMYDRLLAAQASVRHMTHAGPHPEIGSTDKHAVDFVVSTTALLLRYYASR